MTDKKSNTNRRKLLKSIVTGSGVVVAGKSLPESWSKPVVDSVLLPAHAVSTPQDPPCCTIAGSYCGSPTNKFTDWKIKIVVDANGATTISITNKRYSAKAKVPCTGGTFDVYIDEAKKVRMTGKIGCDRADITGNISNPSGVGNVTYRAKYGAC